MGHEMLSLTGWPWPRDDADGLSGRVLENGGKSSERDGDDDDKRH